MSKECLSSTPKNSRGRKKILIDIEQVKKLCGFCHTGEEIAAFLDVDYDTLVSRIKEYRYKNFSEFYKKHSALGQYTLRRYQWKSAQNGNVAMQIWLGKQYLGQKEPERELKQIDITPNQDLMLPEREALYKTISALNNVIKNLTETPYEKSKNTTNTDDIK